MNAPTPTVLASAVQANEIKVSRAEVEEFLYFEAALLDEWKLDEWLELLTEDATYEIPPNDTPDGNSRNTLFILADDIVRIRERVKRLQSPNCHAEFPHSRTRRMISNVRILQAEGDLITVAANFVCYRHRRHERIREFVGTYRFVLQANNGTFKIKSRRAVLDAHELGPLGSVSFIL